MMNMKERLARDLRNTAFGRNGPGEYHIINGKRVRVVIDNDTLRERGDHLGIDMGTLLYYVPIDTFGELPEVGCLQDFDHKAMNVVSVRDYAGLLEVVLEQNRS